MQATDLSIKMRALADRGHPRAVELREKADAFDKATAAMSDPNVENAVKPMMGAWARARRLWSECSGEPLV